MKETLCHSAPYLKKGDTYGVKEYPKLFKEEVYNNDVKTLPLRIAVGQHAQ